MTPALTTSLASLTETIPLWIAGVFLVGGLILWIAGRLVIRPILALVGAGAGAGVGFYLAPAAGGPIFGWPPTTVGVVVGAVLGILTAVLLFRFAMAASGGVVLSMAALLVATTYLFFEPASVRVHPVDQVVAPALSHADQFMEGVPRDLKRNAVADLSDGQARPVNELVTDTAVDRAGALFSAIATEVKAMWHNLPRREQMILGISSGCGLLLGLLMGLLAPIRASSFVTAMLGTALWLPALVWFAGTHDLPGHHLLSELSPAAWLYLWAIVGSLGLLVQVQSHARADNAPAPAGPN